MATQTDLEELNTRVTLLEQRLTAIENQDEAAETHSTSSAESPQQRGTSDHLWALHGLKEREGESNGGTVMVVGSINLPSTGPVSWQIGAHAEEFLHDYWDEAATVLDALAHPVRLRILKEVLEGRMHTAKELAESESMGSKGQVYHHLRVLVSAGWLRSGPGGKHAVPTERVVPLLTTLLGARR
ncbi:helix-turn-helix domain-containing protein [Corynebacterium sp. H128]|uniref:ArsR/SmtB family transcription factor n=1 Tax=Corynebacterium sp. H128 TaxID=3133427 RepID=UPI0030B6AA71